MLKKPFGCRLLILPGILTLLLGVAGCTSRDVNRETVATVNGDSITVSELREFVGVRGAGATASAIPVERKKEALDRLIGGRLLAAHARSIGLDNTDKFREGVERNGQGVLIAALFRKHIAAMNIPAGEVKAESKKLLASDNTLTEENAKSQAEQVVAQRGLRKLEEELISAAKKEFPPNVDNLLIQDIGNGKKVEDGAALATVAGESVNYGEVKDLLDEMTGGMHGNRNLNQDSVAVSRMLDRVVTGRALAAYARKQGIEGSDWMTQVRADMERSILIDLIAEKEILKDAVVTDKEVKDSYEEHAQMFVRDGKRIPLVQVKGQIRQFLENNKRKKALEDYIAGLRKKSKVTVNEAILPKV